MSGLPTPWTTPEDTAELQIGVDYGTPGSDMTAVCIRQGDKVLALAVLPPAPPCPDCGHPCIKVMRQDADGTKTESWQCVNIMTPCEKSLYRDYVALRIESERIARQVSQ